MNKTDTAVRNLSGDYDSSVLLSILNVKEDQPDKNYFQRADGKGVHFVVTKACVCAQPPDEGLGEDFMLEIEFYI